MKRAVSILAGGALLLAITTPMPAFYSEVPLGTWAAADRLAEGRVAAAASPLADGRVLITGGMSGGTTLAAAAIVDAAGQTAAAAPMTTPRSRHTALLLEDGRVLVAGGIGADGAPTASAEVFDPATGAWSAVSSLADARGAHTATRLWDGLVLIAGGEGSAGPLDSLELFDPNDGSFRPAGSLASPRTGHAADAIYGHVVVIAGGNDGSRPLTTIELYDHTRRLVVAGPVMETAREGGSVTALLDGKVLIAGGTSANEDLATTEIFDFFAGTLTPGPSLGVARRDHHAARLPGNGRVLIVGGTAQGVPLASAEWYVPALGTFEPAGAPLAARTQLAGAPSTDGRFLVAGGDAGGSSLDTTELFAFTTVTTDKPDYTPGETVTMTGTGWQPGETVQLRLHELPATHEDVLLTAVADGAGRIVNQEYAPEEHDIGVRFFVTATGANARADATFTDASALSAAAVSPNQVDISWTPTCQTCFCAVDFRPVDSTVFERAGFTTEIAASFSIMSLAPETGYVFRLACMGSPILVATAVTPPLNRAPTANGNSYSVLEDASLTIAAPGVLGDDTDPDGNPISAILVSGPAEGTVALNADGSFTYTPPPNFNGIVGFAYQATDGSLRSNVATVLINVTPVNDLPIAANDTVTTPEDTAVSIPVLANDTDVDGNTLAVALSTLAAHGATAVAGGSVTYTPVPNYFGPDTFKYTIADGFGGIATATVNITVTPVNDPPTFDPIANQVATVASGTQSVEVTGIQPGPSNESAESVSLSATSSNPAIVANPTFSSFAARTFGPVFFGGTGNQRGTSIAVAGGALYVSGDTDANGVDGLVARYDLPLVPSPAWSKTWPMQAGSDEFPGVDASGEGLYVGGSSWTRTTDIVGGKEAKGIVVKFPLTGPTGGGFEGSIWDRQTPAAPGAFPYGGGESIAAVVTTLESGNVYTYATGSGQSSGGNGGRQYLSKLDANGAIVWTVTDPAATPFSRGYAVAVLDGNIYVAGRSDDDGAMRPYLLKYDPAGNLIWSHRSAPVVGQYLGLTAFAGEIYAVGHNFAGSASDFLIEKWDQAGNRLWSQSFDRNGEEDIFYGVVGNGSTIYAVGSTRGAGFGGADVFVMEIGPGTGLSLFGAAWGGAEDDIARGIATDGSEIYIVGETKSFTFNGNGAGENDLMILHYLPSGNAGLSFTPLSRGTATITVTADDGQPQNNTFSRTFNVTVLNSGPTANDDAIVTPEDTPKTFDPRGNDSDPDGDSLTIVSVTQGAHGSVVINGDGTLTYTPAPNYNGPDSFGYAVGDGQGGNDTAIITVTVEPVNDSPVVNAGADQTTSEGGTVNLAPATFNDPDIGDVHTATVDWGDGSAVDAGVVGPGTVSGSHLYADNGTYTVAVCVKDGAGASACDTLTVTVNNVAPAVSAGADATVNEGSAFAGAGSFTDPGADTWTATVDYGDGSGVQPLALNADKTFALNHGYAQDGVYVVAVTVTDDDGASGTDTLQVTVNNVVPVFTALAVSPTSISEDGTVSLAGTFTDPGLLDPHTLTVSWGEGAPEAVPVVNVSPGVFSFSASHRYLDDDPTGTPSDGYVVGVVVTDDDGASSGAGAVTVSNVAPVITGITGPGPLALGTPATVAATFTDVGTLDTHQCTFAWDDGQPDTTTAGAAGSCSATHVYAGPGVYTVGVTVTDDDTGAATSRYEFVVIYDPSDGYVTGGGWIMSPEGAYEADPSATGKATFGFVSKYKRGANVPTGETTFQFHAGDFKFQSSVYEWLVVAGARSQYKGSGTVNGSGDYGFLLTATDGDVSGGGGIDRFRIKVWNKVTGGVVYDNRRGASEDMDSADPQDISQGSIVVHHN